MSPKESGTGTPLEQRLRIGHGCLTVTRPPCPRCFYVRPRVRSAAALHRLGGRCRLRRAPRDGSLPSRTAALDSAVFARFGLLIAFTFSGAASRFDTRRDLIVQDANAIGTQLLAAINDIIDVITTGRWRRRCTRRASSRFCCSALPLRARCFAGYGVGEARARHWLHSRIRCDCMSSSISSMHGWAACPAGACCDPGTYRS